MATTLEDVKSKALELPAPERDELVRALIASVDGETDASPAAIAEAWAQEIDRRIDDLESGRDTGVPADRVLAELRLLIDTHTHR